MKKLLGTILTLLASFTVYSQSCGSDEYLQILIEKNPSLSEVIDNSSISYKNARLSGALPDATIMIPVVVHILEYGGITEITDEDVKSQLIILNNDFNTIQGNSGLGVDTKIQFCLAKRDPNGNFSSGILRQVATKETYYPFSEDGSGNFPDDELIKNYSQWPSEKYLNIWVCNDIRKNNGDGLLGYSTLPFKHDGISKIDGVVVNMEVFGIKSNPVNPDNNLGKTLTHEVGHWCGLFHTFQLGPKSRDGACENTDCNLNGDLVCDTYPVLLWANRSTNITSENCSQREDCDGNTISAENFMEWNYDACQSFFTHGQKVRMHLMLKENRSFMYNRSINNPAVIPVECIKTNTTTNSPYVPPLGGPVYSPCNTYMNVNGGFYINKQNTTTVNICPGSKIKIDYDGGEPCMKVPPACTFPCNTHQECDWVDDLLDWCDHTCRLEPRFWVSIYYDCDNNYNCANEIGNWFNYQYNFDVGALLSFTFEAGKFYRIKYANDLGCDGTGWTESTKQVYILSNDPKTFSNTTISSGTYTFPNKITIENSSNNAGSNISMTSSEEIIILPNSTLSNEFSASIVSSIFCATSSQRIGKNSPSSVSRNIKTSEIAKDSNFKNFSHYNDSKKFSIIPNPSSGMYKINFPALSVKKIIVRNILGKTVYQSGITEENEMNVDLSNFPSGIYILEAEKVFGYSEMYKLIKQ